MLPEPIKLSIISLGCPKNLVDTEVLLARAAEKGAIISFEPEDCDILVINTCAFIEEARKEAGETIEFAQELKRNGKVKGIIVVGCLPQRYRHGLHDLFPEVDLFCGISDYRYVFNAAARLLKGGKRGHLKGLKLGLPKGPLSDSSRLVLTAPSFAYLRISEGCNHRCSFCAIPMIRGRQRSKPLKQVIKEAEMLARLGKKEVVLIGEDTTSWGKDLEGRRQRLPDLLEKLSDVRGLKWIRILYGYPWAVDRRLLEAIASLPKVVPYLDIPIQHIDEHVLRRMGRGRGGEKLKRKLLEIREMVPGIALRTSLLLGHPGETPRRFEALLKFVEDFKFERLGAFAFSPERGTRSFAMKPRPSSKEAMKRRDMVMKLQYKIAREKNMELLGTETEAIIDMESPEPGMYIGRTHGDAPEIDCVIGVESKKRLSPGKIVKVRVTGFYQYDLVGKLDFQEEK